MLDDKAWANVAIDVWASPFILAGGIVSNELRSAAKISGPLVAYHVEAYFRLGGTSETVGDVWRMIKNHVQDQLK